MHHPTNNSNRNIVIVLNHFIDVISRIWKISFMILVRSKVTYCVYCIKYVYSIFSDLVENRRLEIDKSNAIIAELMNIPYSKLGYNLLWKSFSFELLQVVWLYRCIMWIPHVGKTCSTAFYAFVKHNIKFVSCHISYLSIFIIIIFVISYK